MIYLWNDLLFVLNIGYSGEGARLGLLGKIFVVCPSVVYFDQTLVEIFIFSFFVLKSFKKCKKVIHLVQKNRFLSLHQNAGQVFILEEKLFFGNKTLDQRFGANLTNHFLH